MESRSVIGRTRARGRARGPAIEAKPPEALTRTRTSGRGRTTSFDMTAVAKSLPTVPVPVQKAQAAPKRNVQRQTRVVEDSIITRPEWLSSKKGKSGTTIRMNTNYFKLTSITDFMLYQYRVDFAPEEETTAAKIQLLKIHKEALGGYIFDGSVMFTAKKLDKDIVELFSSRETDGTKMRITVRLVGVLSTGDPQYLQVFNILVRWCLQGLNLQLVGRHYFDAQSSVPIRNYSLELWPGYITSIRQHEDEILMCTEITHKVMRMETVHDILKRVVQNNPQNFKEEFKKKVIGSIVLTDYSNKTYRVDDVDFTVSPRNTFTRPSGETCYMDYYKNAYGIIIKDQQQPLLVSQPKQRDRRRGINNLIYLIPELCRTTGITDEMRSNFSLMRALAEHTRLGPATRQERLRKFQDRLRTNPQVQKDLKQWNMSLSDELVTVPARVLDPEKIYLQKAQCTVGQKNDWTQEVKSRGLLSAPVLKKWGILCPNSQLRACKEFQFTLQKAAAAIDFKIEDGVMYSVQEEQGIAGYIQALDHLLSSFTPQIILIILQNKRADRYNALKRRCCVDRAVATQVVLLKNTRGKNIFSVASKIVIQMCCKIGGAPWSVEIPLSGLMVVGFDVYHDTASRGVSIGALVASMNKALSRYFSAVSYQHSGEELSNELSINMCKALQKFQTMNGSLPERIIIYRDGVGEGQIPFVMEHEVELLKGRLKEIYGGRTAKMTFIIVTKRINSRVFHDKQNPPPGTIVDDVITLAQRYDFFLVSQSVRQGTVSPTSYNIIYDHLGLDPDKIQRLTYKLTHMYFNWSGTVRVPAPVQYAHKLAFLVGQSLHTRPSNALEDFLYFL
ncbi:LOW QUALITY PROTEIN: piwi-like protein Siwi [Schistocerca gregaria]|uniref:LOW QUALITY PROTEIN: piwi-like protein Siwi n=1 Tax=Schistocerca gregaria TaxID=7010 RepID=UPI00211E27F0|nr:LOW QUALITY PROTEIN: piwi-like protein Siwi [Schistocerca gregaria]